MTDWLALIKKNKGNISDSTARTYSSSIRGMLSHMGVADAPPDFFATHSKEVVAHLLKNVKVVSRKNCLSAALATLPSKGKDDKVAAVYRKQMMSDIKEALDDRKDQEKSATESKNWITQKQVLEVYKELEAETAHLWSKKNLREGDVKKLMGFVLLSCFVLIPPRRTMDYRLFKLRHINKEEDNFMSGRFFIFNKYKTAKSYGSQKIAIPEKLRGIITKWAARHDHDWLLFDSKGAQLPASKVTLLLNRVFGKRISCNMLRHIFISDEVLPNMPKLTALEEVAREMGHSVNTQITYKKVDKDLKK